MTLVEMSVISKSYWSEIHHLSSSSVL